MLSTSNLTFNLCVIKSLGNIEQLSNQVYHYKLLGIY